MEEDLILNGSLIRGFGSSAGYKKAFSFNTTTDMAFNSFTYYNGNVEPESDEIRVFLGSYVHSESRENPLVICSNGLIGVEKGKIVFVDVEDNLAALKEEYSFSTDSVNMMGRGEFLTPGFVDTHIHASQYPNAGLATHLPVLEWLCKYTFPMEARYKDTAFARSAYKKVVQRTLCNGTTTASYFATIHRQSTEILADVVEQYGQRGLIGKVCMDSNSPNYYVESTYQSLKSSEDFILSMLNRKSKRVKPIVTPRFALSCSEELLTGLGALAKKYNVPIQTHLCESEEEVGRALKLFPQYKSYGEIYEKTGLMINKSIMAHCVFLNEDELNMIATSGAGVAHCPTSNICLLNGLCPVRKLLNAGIKVGLGTDLSAGYSPSILEAMRHAILTSKVLKVQSSCDYEPLTYKDAFYLATLGGAEALSMSHEIGNFQVGKAFDALHIDIAATGSPMHLFPGEGLEDMFQKFVMLGDDRNIAQVFVDGRKVKMTL